MADATLYDDDVYAWAYEQAALLRELAATRRDLPNALDVENLAEEIEGVARTDLRQAGSFMRLLLVHLLKAVSAPDSFPLEHWRIEIAVFQDEFQTQTTKTILRKLETEKVWRLAVRQAAAQLDLGGDVILPGLPQACPFTSAELADEAFDIDAALDRIRRSAAG